jgi:hypothetical protein
MHGMNIKLMDIQFEMSLLSSTVLFLIMCRLYGYRQ